MIWLGNMIRWMIFRNDFWNHFKRCSFLDVVISLRMISWFILVSDGDFPTRGRVKMSDSTWSCCLSTSVMFLSCFSNSVSSFLASNVSMSCSDLINDSNSWTSNLYASSVFTVLSMLSSFAKANVRSGGTTFGWLLDEQDYIVNQ